MACVCADGLWRSDPSLANDYIAHSLQTHTFWKFLRYSHSYEMSIFQSNFIQFSFDYSFFTLYFIILKISVWQY